MRRTSATTTRDFTEPRDDDILGGKGGHTNHHLGNVRYRKTVRHFQAIFELRQCNAEDKRLLAKSIASTLREMFGTRFLAFDRPANAYKIMTYKATIKKIMQCFREKTKGFEITARTDQQEERVTEEALRVTHIILSRQYPEIYKGLQQRFSADEEDDDNGNDEKDDKAGQEMVIAPKPNDELSSNDVVPSAADAPPSVADAVPSAVPSCSKALQAQDFAPGDDEFSLNEDLHSLHEDLLSLDVLPFQVMSDEMIPQGSPWLDKLCAV